MFFIFFCSCYCPILTGKIYYHEFLASTISRKAITEENVRIAFEKISSHNDVITSSDLRNLLGIDASWKSVCHGEIYIYFFLLCVISVFLFCVWSFLSFFLSFFGVDVSASAL